RDLLACHHVSSWLNGRVLALFPGPGKAGDGMSHIPQRWPLALPAVPDIQNFDAGRHDPVGKDIRRDDEATRI
ncbi:MAG TPA: hypothetical protein VN900_13025, partial [Stellaceae bacterium]|nr:hypothetical protein [Stellaceae bacterium]